MIWQSVQSVLTLLLMMSVGFLVADKPWFGKYGEDLFSKYCLNIGIPCYMVVNIASTCESREELFGLLRFLPIPFAMILSFLLLGFVLFRVLKIDPRRKGLFINVLAFSNTVIVGFPITLSLFGEEALPTALSYYIANTILFWTAGAWLLRQDGGQNAQKTFSLASLKKIFSLPIIGFLVGSALVLFNITLPDWIFSPLQQIGKTATPIAMIFIGSVLRHANLQNIRLSRDMIILLVCRFLLSPAILLVLYLVLPLPAMAKQVYLIMTVMPAMTQFGIVSKESGADYEYASLLIAITTMVSMAVIPLYTIVMSQIFTA